uniref:Cell cycle checkpoint protein RAD1 n=1 Tax=Syphacia muris TaxID=451379 RepID=A0A158R4U6_9BILA
MNVGNDALSTQRHVFELKLDNALDFQHVVKALIFREYATFDVSSNGLRLIVDDQSCLQSVAYIQKEIFSLFQIGESTVSLRIPIAVLAESLSVFGSGNNVALKMTYDGEGEPLKIMLEKDGIVVKCIIRTQNPDVILDFDFGAFGILAKVILKPQKLKEVLQDLDASSPTVDIKVSRHGIYVSTEGEMGKIRAEFPQRSEQIEHLDCSEDVEHKYRLALIKRMLPSLTLSQKVSLRIDSRGVLSLQFMIESSESSHIFIEFFCVPDAEVFDDRLDGTDKA